MILWAGNLGHISKLPLPVDPISHQPVPHGSVLDFETIPVSMQFLEALVLWLRYRGIKVPTVIGKDRVQIVNLVNNALRLNLSIDLSSVDPTEGVGHYISFDKLFTTNPVTWFQFDTVHDANVIVSVVRNRLPSIDKDYIDKIFGICRNGVRLRAIRSATSGNYVLDSIKMAKALATTSTPSQVARTSTTVEGGGSMINGAPQPQADQYTPCFVFSVDVTPSLKSSNYQVHIVVRQDNGEYMPTPRSRCTCPAGQLFCSHMLGFYLIMYSFQQRPSWDPIHFINLFPEPVKLVQTIPLLLSEAMRVNKRKNRKRRT